MEQDAAIVFKKRRRYRGQILPICENVQLIWLSLLNFRKIAFVLAVCVISPLVV